MKLNFNFVLFFFLPFFCFSQNSKVVTDQTNSNNEAFKSNIITYDNLSFEYTFYSYLKIEKIVIDNDKTIVNLMVDNSNGSRQLDLYFVGEEKKEAFVLQDDKTKSIYKQIRSSLSNMPTGNETKFYTVKIGEKMLFTIAFEKINPIVSKINLLDGGEVNWDKKSGVYWNIYGIKPTEKIVTNIVPVSETETKLSYFKDTNGKYGFKNQKGKVIIPAKFESVQMECEDGRYCSAKLNGNWGIINNSGKVLIPFEYEYIERCFREGVIMAQKNGKQGFVDKNNNVIVPFKYTNAAGFENGETDAKLDGVWVKIFLNDYVKSTESTESNYVDVVNQPIKQGVYYTGQTINGKPSGKGKMSLDNGEWYEGEFRNGVENGVGTRRDSKGFRYTGNFENGLPNGTFKIQKWTLMGLASDEWTAVYKNGKLISSTQTESGITDVFNNNSTSVNSEAAKTEGHKNCDWKVKSKTSSSADFDNTEYGTKTILWELKKEGIDGSKPHYKISGTSYLGTEVRYYYNDGGDVITTGGKKLGIASSINDAAIMLLKEKFCK
jgi:hypothetical protein